MAMKKSPAAFTLIEVILAITVFTLFMGFAVASYLSFHRADQEALVDRSLLMEGSSVVSAIAEDVKDSKIDTDYYDDGKTLSILSLLSADGMTRTVYEWDSKDGSLTRKMFTRDESGVTSGEPVRLTSEQVYLKDVQFRIFPPVDPYDPTYASESESAYQPLVTLDLTFATAGRVRSEVTLNLHTSVTSRLYQ